MRALLIGAATAAGLAGAGLAGAAAAQGAGGAPDGPVPPGAVVVECYRGPLRETLWDHPRAAFVDSLAAAGHDRATARAIGFRVCRDAALVGDDAALKAAVERLVAQAPR